MTTTGLRPATPVSTASPLSPPRRPLVSGVRRTLVTYLACLLGALPLLCVVNDAGWLLDAYAAMGIALLPALVLRFRREPGALQVWPGIVLLALLLTARYLPDHAIFGLVPGGGTWSDLTSLLDNLHNTMRSQTAPVHSTEAVRFALSLILALVAALVDLLAVVGRHGALAGLPLLVIFSASGAMVRGAVPWPIFVLSAVAFLLLLSLDAPDDVAMWGHRIVRPGVRRGRSSTALTGVRIGALALVIAMLGAAFIPFHGRNLVADAIRHTDAGSGGNGTSIDPFAGLRGDLKRGDPLKLATVRITRTGGPDAQPFYLRTNVLETFTDKGWGPAEPQFTTPVSEQSFPLYPDEGDALVPRMGFVATISTKALSGPPPVFAYPTRIAGLNPGTRWSPDAQTLIGKVSQKQTYVITAAQPVPSVGDLYGGASYGAPAADMSRWLQLPQPQPPLVQQTLRQILGNGQHTPFAATRLIEDYFTTPANGFTYSLSTVKGDSGNDLVDFLTYKQGFCQQYAAAMGVLLRMAGVPSRVVIGFSHPVPDKQGAFTITSADAHAWVEAYLQGAGWVSFDPTPLAGISGGVANDLPWAPHPPPPPAGPPNASRHPTGSEPAAHPNQSPSPGSSSATSSQHSAPWGWIGFGLGAVLVLALLAVPSLVRTLRTRRRLLAARGGDSEALWAELADTARDVGYVWSPARTPRQVARWLAEPLGPTAPALDTLARAVEQARYAPMRDATENGVAQLVQVRAALRGRLTIMDRVRVRLLPASVLPRLGRRQHR